MNKKSFKIGFHKLIGGGNVFIIAEAGVNHNGRLDLALKLVDVAARIGADCVKFQTFKADNVVKTDADRKQLEMLKRVEFPEKFYPQITKRCKQKGILFLSTPHGGKKSVEFLESLKIPAYKIGSGDVTNYILLEKVASLNKPIILSTGMSTLKEVKDAVNFIKSYGNKKIVLLHCTSAYPCAYDEVNLNVMREMISMFDLPVGYSDHTQGIQTAIMAATLGASIYEFHLTLDKNLDGPDHKASADPREAKERIEAIRKVNTILGQSTKKPTNSESRHRIKIGRRSIVSVRNLKKGHTLTTNDLEAKRPGYGVSPTEFKKMIGQKLKKNIQKDEFIKFSDLE